MLRLPTIGRLWEGFAVQADKEGWGAARFLAALCEHEIADRDQRRIARHLNESGLPAGKTFATFDFAAVPTLRKTHVLALADSDTWLDQGSADRIDGPVAPCSIRLVRQNRKRPLKMGFPDGASTGDVHALRRRDYRQTNASAYTNSLR